jgi:hypothetical protein
VTRWGTRERPAADKSPAADWKSHRFVESPRRQFRETAHGLTRSASAPKPKSRRRSGGDTRGGFRLPCWKTVHRADRHIQNARLRHTVDLWNGAAAQHTRKNETSVAGVSHQPSSAGEIINWYRANGYSMREIRAMFPGLFAESPSLQPQSWDASDWLDLWNWNNPSPNEGCGHFHYAESHHLSPEM